MAFFNTAVAAMLLSLSVAVAVAASSTPDADVPTDVFEYYPMDPQETDWYNLMQNMTAAADKVELFLTNEVEKGLKDRDSDKGCLLVCKDVCESAVNALKTGMKSVSAYKYAKGRDDVTAFNTFMHNQTCNHCFTDFLPFADWADTVTGGFLDKIVKYIH